MRVAFLHFSIGKGVGGGGASRFFIDYYREFYLSGRSDVELFFFTEEKARKQEVGSGKLPPGVAIKRLIPLTVFSNRLKHVVEGLQFFLKLRYHKVDVVHICQYQHQSFYHLIQFLNKMPRWLSPKVAINFIHCNFPYEYNDPAHPNSSIFHERFDPLFKNLRIDGVFSWYKLFCEFSEKERLFAHPVLCYPIRYYCCDSTLFKPSNHRENIIVYAARLDNQKNPMMFLEAVSIANREDKEAFNGWKIMLCGRGELLWEVAGYIERNQLSDLIDLRSDVFDMSPIFSKSKCFVSTQDFENFTSLSMIEAMATGNAIIARNVGQTGYFVKDNVNGLLLQDDTEQGLADKLLYFLKNPQLHAGFSEESLRIVREEHSFDNFTQELKTFWAALLKSK